MPCFAEAKDESGFQFVFSKQIRSLEARSVAMFSSKIEGDAEQVKRDDPQGELLIFLSVTRR